MKEFLGYTMLGIVLNIVISFTINLLPPNITSDYDIMMKQDRAESLYLIFFYMCNCGTNGRRNNIPPLYL